MWKRRAEIGTLALLIVAAAAARPSVEVKAPRVDIAALLPDRLEPTHPVARVAVAVIVDLID